MLPSCRTGLALLFAVTVANQIVITVTQSPQVTLGELLTSITSSGLFELQGILLDLSYNVGGVAGDKLVDKLPCRPEPDEDEDACRNITEMIRSRKFEVENHQVVSKDGYILSIQRVINPLVDRADRSKLKPVLLVHGALSSAVDWVFYSQYARPTRWPPEQATNATGGARADEFVSEEEQDRRNPRSLAFYLANRGYDVFLPNLRGSKYSLGHLKKTPKDPLYWRFSLDEQIDFDLPAMIKFVQRETGYDKISFVGWSQSSTLMFGLLSDYPEYADVIEPYIAFAPIAYLHNAKTPFMALAPLVFSAQNRNMGIAFSDALRYGLKKACGPTEAQKLACLSFANQLYGDNSEEYDIHRLRTFTHHFPAGTSLKTAAHYSQSMLSRRFARYNHGLLGNKKRYGTVLPPEYNLTNIRSQSLYLFTADNDYLADPTDVQLLVSKLRYKPVERFNMTEFDPKWNHMAYVYHKKAGSSVNPRVAAILDRYR